MTPVTMCTERLRMRPWRDDDKAALAAINADPRVMEFFPSVLNRVESDAGHQRLCDHFERYGWGFWALEERDSGILVGFTGLQTLKPEMPFAPGVEIGWRLARQNWGRGYAVEAARRALTFAFDELSLSSVVAFTPCQNTRSERVMHKLGMQQEGTFDHPGLASGHRLRRHLLYRVSAPAE